MLLRLNKAVYFFLIILRLLLFPTFFLLFGITICIKSDGVSLLGYISLIC